jgi:hypothetical protein
MDVTPAARLMLDPIASADTGLRLGIPIQRDMADGSVQAA